MTEQSNAELIAAARSLIDQYDPAFAFALKQVTDRLEAADQRAAELAAVVEKVRERAHRVDCDPYKGATSQNMDALIVQVNEIRRLLATAPADALRELKADVWDEGEEAGMKNQANWDGWRDTKPPITNPYRKGQVMTRTPTTDDVRHEYAVSYVAEYQQEARAEFDAWLAEHDAELIDSLIEGIGSGTYTHRVGEGIEVALDQLHAAKAELREEQS